LRKYLVRGIKMINKTLLGVTVLLFLAPFARADVYQSPSGTGSCLIPDNSTLTNITVYTDSENPLWNPTTVCSYSGVGFTGVTTAWGTDLELGEVTFDVPVTDVVYNFDYSDWWIGPGSITYLPQNPNGEGFISGEVSSIFWMSCANGPDQINYNGIIDISFNSPLTPLSEPVPEPHTSLLVLIGLSSLLIWRRFSLGWADGD
jgi:hypothetical protein